MIRKHLNTINLCTTLILLISSVLAILKIGPYTEPMFTYITSTSTMNIISICVSVFSLSVATYLVFSLISKKIKNKFSFGLTMGLILLPIEVLLGGNLIYILSLTVMMLVCLFNLSSNKKRA